LSKTFVALNVRTLWSYPVSFLIGVGVENFFALLDLVKRRLRDIDIAGINQRAEESVEQSEQESSDVRAVDIGIGRDDDFVVAEFLNIESVSDGSAESHD